MKKSLSTILASLFAILTYAQVGVGTTTPNSTLDVRGSLSTNYRSFTANTTAAATDHLLVFTGSSAAAVTLPTAIGCDGRSYMIKNASTTGPTPVLTIATTAAQTIDGAGSWTLTSANETITLVSNGANWQVAAQSLPGGSGVNWSQNGNSVASVKSIGTINNFSLPFITNNTEKMRLTNTGSLGIGTSTFNGTYPEKLLVDAGTTTSVNAIVGKGTIDSYLQLNIQNNSAGTSASSDVVATANNGSETTNYVDMGINGGSNTSNIMGAANDAYLYNIGQNMLVGTGSASKSLVFMTGGTAQSTNERMRIDGNGNVGIGNTNPLYKLQVTSASNPLYLGGVQTGAGTDSVVTINNGVVRKISAAAAAANAWSLTGNAATTPGTNFIGTTDAQAFVIKENNTQVGRFDANSIAFGNGATVNNSSNSYAIGSTATVGFNKSHAYAIGSAAAVNADSSFAIGIASVVNGNSSVAIGNGAAANNTNSVALGKNAFTAYTITDAVAIGTNATANSSNSIAIGSNSNSSNKTTTNAASAIAIGNNAVSNSTNAVVIGTGATTGFNLTNPVAIGVSSSVGGNNGVALGNGSSIGFNANATAIGSGAAVSGTGANSTAIGYNASATLPNEIILGDRTSTALSVGIGTESFSATNREKLLVDAGTTTSVNAIVGKGTIDSYLQLNIQNNSNGTSASSDVVATANNGSETSNYIDMGINGGSYSGGVMGGANDGYLYTMGNNFLLGTANAAKSLVFMTGGTSQATNERMRIDGTGNVGIGKINPSQKLDINGNLNLSGAFMPGNTAGTTGHFLVSAGAGVAPTWFDASGYAWTINGNNVPSVKTIGTTNAFDLPFITNNTEKMRLMSNGNLGVGTSTFNGTNPEKFLVDAGTTTSVNAIVGKGSIDSYLQLNIQNNSAGTSASSDVVATANNGNETTNFVDMGINGGNYSGGIMGAANDSYLYNQGQNFLIGTGTAAKSLLFMTGGTSQAANERMRIDGNGNVGIGINNPAYKLQVNAASNPLYLGGVQSGAGTDSVLTIANGVVKKLHPTALPGSNYGWGITGNVGINTATNFLGTTDDKQMILKSNGQSYLEFGRRQTLGLTQAFADYDDNDEKVTYVRSALQFDAPNANFYKPKMFTDVNGNFRVKGSSAGTDYFEFGSTGASNNGGFEFIIGDDGDEPILFKSYNYLTGMSEIMRLQSGRMAVGSNAFNATNPEKLLIDAGVTTSYNLMTGKGSIDNYLQINVQNRSAGNSASSDLVATADNGTETNNYIDMGVNSSGYNNTAVPVLNGINNTYLYGAGNDLTIGNLGNNKPIIFFTTPNATQANAAERMRIDGTGNVGIGTTTATSTLQVNGSQALSITTKTATYTATASDYTIICNNSGAIAINLPAASGCSGRVYVIKKISGLFNNVTIDGNASETIDGATTKVLTMQYESVMVQSNGTSWFILN